MVNTDYKRGQMSADAGDLAPVAPTAESDETYKQFYQGWTDRQAEMAEQVLRGMWLSSSL